MSRRRTNRQTRRLPTGSWPFGVLGGLGLLLALQPAAPLHTGVLAAAAVLTGLAVLTECARARSGTLGLKALPPLLYLVSVALLREATGGATGGMGGLAILSVVWIALHGNRLDLALVIVGVIVMFVAPVALIGAPSYPAGGWRSAILLAGLVTVVGITVQRLLDEVRLQADLARRREQERLALLQRLESQAATDPLTGLANRRAWTTRLDTELAAAGFDGRAVCLALVDLDGFKARNDSEGHEAGDAVLRAAAEAWTRELRPTDLLARLGGDEFGVLLPDCPLADALPILERLRAATPGALTCSAGLVEMRRGESARELQSRADLALYAAKDAGRDRTVSRALVAADET